MLFRGTVTLRHSRHKYAIKSEYNESVPPSLNVRDASQVGLITRRSFRRNGRLETQHWVYYYLCVMNT